MSAKRKAKRPTRSWVTYERSCLVTLGLVLIAVTAFVWMKQSVNFSEWPVWAYFLFGALPIFGALVIGIGLFADREEVDKWANGASQHWASILLMILAFPVYLIMSALEKNKEDS